CANTARWAAAIFAARWPRIWWSTGASTSAAPAAGRWRRCDPPPGSKKAAAQAAPGRGRPPLTAEFARVRLASALADGILAVFDKIHQAGGVAGVVPGQALGGHGEDLGVGGAALLLTGQQGGQPPLLGGHGGLGGVGPPGRAAAEQAGHSV